MFLKRVLVCGEVISVSIDSNIFVMPGNLHSMGVKILKWLKNPANLDYTDVQFNSFSKTWHLDIVAPVELNNDLMFDITAMQIEVNALNAQLSIFLHF